MWMDVWEAGQVGCGRRGSFGELPQTASTNCMQQNSAQCSYLAARACNRRQAPTSIGCPAGSMGRRPDRSQSSLAAITFSAVATMRAQER